jgi:hypothetical protein
VTFDNKKGELKMTKKFDFEDGRGLVLAHQHKNSDGSIGGWVEDNCEVSADSHISVDSSVCNNSRVYNNSSVYNSRVDNSSVCNSRVYNNSSVYNSSVYNNSSVCNSRVYNNSRVDNSSVYNNSRVDNSSVYNNSRVDNSRVCNSEISNTKQIYSQSPIGSRNDKCSAFIGDKDSEIMIVTGCFKGTIDEFEQAVLKTHGHNNYGKEYLSFIQNAKNHFEIWGYLPK